jgi:hypothetical protein
VCDVTDAVMFELPHTLQAPSRARALVEQVICPVHARAALGAAQVVVSELATIAVLYGRPPVVLDLDCGVTQLRIAVTHQAEGAFVRDIPVGEGSVLRSALLSRLTRSWGVERTPEVRTIWSHLVTGAIPEQSRRGMETRVSPLV